MYSKKECQEIYDYQLSKNFSLWEFIHSQKAEELGIDNKIADFALDNLQVFINKLLQPLRSLYGKPITIGSGYRCDALNEAVEGSKTSQHRMGLAADLYCDSPQALLSTLKASGLQWGQAILYPTFLHLSYDRGSQRCQVII